MMPPQSMLVPTTSSVTLVFHVSLLPQMRLRLLDELERLTAAGVDCGRLAVRLSGACLQGLHLELVGGTPSEVANWMAGATALLHEAAGYVTAPQQRLAVVPVLPPQALPASVQGGAV
jgi:hypothetical protein